MIVRENINFERGLDPKRSIGIGLQSPRRFKSIDELVDYIIDALPIIFDGKIPDDILSKEENGMVPSSYYIKIIEFLNRVGHESPNGNYDWTFINDPGVAFWPILLINRLERILGQKRWDPYI